MSIIKSSLIYSIGTQSLPPSRGSSPSFGHSTPFGYSTQMSAKESMKGALENVKKRYWRNLDRFNLVESLFYDREDLCELILVEPIGDSPLYKIRYWKSSNQLERSRLMPKDVAE